MNTHMYTSGIYTNMYDPMWPYNVNVTCVLLYALEVTVVWEFFKVKNSVGLADV